ncbi:MAG: hypothetical protein AAF351_11085 [Pseudomonadota bacterium]
MRTTLCVLLALLLTLSGCAVNEVIQAEETTLVVAEAPPEEESLLDIGIIQFHDGVEEDNDPQDSGIYDEIRAAESRYLAYHLKQTMQSAGHWGAVRVIPGANAFTDVLINGRIIESDGEFITLEIDVTDASGLYWYSKQYATQTGVSSYSINRDKRNDPYQKVFNDIANDLHNYVAQLPPEYVHRIRQVSELQFFADMSPRPYAEYLQANDEGNYVPVRLPAENDPAVARLRQIRERDRLVVDTLNEHYANFYYGIAIPYHSWRKTAREESVNYRQVKRSATMQTLLGAVVLAGSLAVDTDQGGKQSRRINRSLQFIGINEGINTMFRGVTRRSEARIHLESIKELSESFGAEAAPMVVSVEGQSRRLTGTAAAQYDSWRRILREIYEAETGFIETDELEAPERIPESGG